MQIRDIPKWGIQDLYTKFPKFDSTDAEHVPNLVNDKHVAVNVQQYSLLHGYAIPAQHFLPRDAMLARY